MIIFRVGAIIFRAVADPLPFVAVAVVILIVPTATCVFTSIVWISSAACLISALVVFATFVFPPISHDWLVAITSVAVPIIVTVRVISAARAIRPAVSARAAASCVLT